MPRPHRVHVDNGFYHVTLRGNHQQTIFVEEGDQRLLNRIVERAVEKYRARVHAYCWMTNHLHFLMQVADEPLGRSMRQIAAEFARAMQSKLQTTGHFFERRYHATLVDDESYLKSVVRYIHLNPVVAGVVEDPADFLWSSHRAYLGAPREPWLVTDFVLQNFGSTREHAVTAYKGFMDIAEDDWIPGVNHRPESVSPTEVTIGHARQAAPIPAGRQTLTELIAEACTRFEVGLEGLKSPVRDDYLTIVRAWIANQAKVRHVASLADVARELRRHEATLRQAMRRYPQEIE